CHLGGVALATACRAIGRTGLDALGRARPGVRSPPPPAPAVRRPAAATRRTGERIAGHGTGVAAGPRGRINASGWRRTNPWIRSGCRWRSGSCDVLLEVRRRIEPVVVHDVADGVDLAVIGLDA